MKKNLIVSLTLLTLVLTACGVQPTQTQPEPVAPTQAEIQLTAVPTEANVATDTTTSATEAPATGVSFANDVMPIFAASCNDCHGGKQTKAGLDLTTHESVMAGSFNGGVITTGNSADSLLVQLVTDGEMPKRGSDLTAEQIQIIRDWVDAGALNN